MTRWSSRRLRATIVAHLDPAESTIFKFYVDSPRPGIDCILDQFFERSGGTFDYFSGRNSVNQAFGKAANLRHKGQPNA